MLTRRLKQLKRDQFRLLETCRAERQSEGPVGNTQAPDQTAVRNVAWVGQVTDIVVDHRDRGPHLLVVRQVFWGSPPKPRDAGPHACVCYATPGRTVCDYAVGELVSLLHAEGARLAVKLA